MQTVLYPGSFDPVTTGHMDIIRRVAGLFDRVIVGILHNAEKPSGAFSVTERIVLLEDATAGLPNVEIQAFSGLLVDAVESSGAQAVVRGLRSAADVEIELQMARLNRHIGGVETLLLAAQPQVVHVSASMVREVGRYGGDLRGLVPDEILTRVVEGLRPQT